MRRLVTAFVIGALACSGKAAPTEQTEESNSASSSSPHPCDAGPAPAPACGAAGKRCVKDADCCAGFCASLDFGYYGYGYGYGVRRCSAPQPNGASCYADNQCTSGHCDQYECKAPAPACAALASPCTTTADCCPSSFCNTDTYAPPTCTALRANGAWCLDASECQSGACVDYTCQ